MPELVSRAAIGDLPTARVKLLDKLGKSSSVPVGFSLAEDAGTISDLRGSFALTGSGKLETKVGRYLKKIAPAVGLPKGLKGLTRVSTHDLGDDGSRVFYEQRTQGDLPLVGAGVGVEVDRGGAVTGVTARMSQAEGFSATPTLDAQGAAAAMAAQIVTESSAPTTPELVVVDPMVLLGENDPPFLGWRSLVAGESGPVQVIQPDGGGTPIVLVVAEGSSSWNPIPQYHVNPATGTPDFITFAPFGLLLPESLSASATAVALALFTRHPTLYGTGNVPNQLSVMEVVTDSGPHAMTHVRLQQMYGGHPVFGCQLVVHLTPTLAIMSVGGNYLRDPGVLLEPRVSQEEARQTAVMSVSGGRLAKITPNGRGRGRAQRLSSEEIITRLMGSGGLGEDAVVHQVVTEHKAQVTDCGLEIYPGVLSGDEDAGNHLVWRFRFIEGDVSVSAIDGKVVFASPHFQSKRIILDAKGQGVPGTLLASQVILVDGVNVNPTPASDPDIMPADAGLAGAIGFWAMLGRNSFDNRGSDVSLFTNSGVLPGNAMWVPVLNQMWMGLGEATADIIAHELTHGVTFSSSCLLYLDEPGALNEHYSDVMGCLAAPDVPATSWLLGEGAASGGARNLANPVVGNYASFRRRTGACLGVLAPITNTACDAGGVHTNSGIGNKAAVLISDGEGTRPGIGRSKMGRIFADTLTTRLTPWSRYFDEMANSWEVARDLSRRGVIPATLPSDSGTQTPFSGAAAQDQVTWGFNQVGVDRRLQTGWFEVAPCIFGIGGKGDTVMMKGQTLPAPSIVTDLELVVKATVPESELGYWTASSRVSAGGAISFAGGIFGARITQHAIGTDSPECTVHWWHEGLLPFDFTVNVISSTPSLPVVTEHLSAPQVHWSVFGDKGDEVVNSGVKLQGSGCVITDVILELLDRDYNVQATHQVGHGAASWGGTGANITSAKLNSDDATVGVHWWHDLGSACRYQLRYLVQGTGCSF